MKQLLFLVTLLLMLQSCGKELVPHFGFVSKDPDVISIKEKGLLLDIKLNINGVKSKHCNAFIQGSSIVGPFLKYRIILVDSEAELFLLNDGCCIQEIWYQLDANSELQKIPL